MGFFDFIKKKPLSDEIGADFVNFRGISLEKCTVGFTGCEPGYFLVNGKPAFVGLGYVDDIGPSSDLKYSRIATPEYTFWVNHKDANCLRSNLLKTRLAYANMIYQSHRHDTPFEEYLGSARDYFELSLCFNVVGTSHDYGYGKGSIISKLSPGDKLLLDNFDSQSDPVQQIYVVDSEGRQIGWYPTQEPLTLEDVELLSQIKAGVRIEATVAETGRVNESDNLWCRVEYALKMPYPASEECVYVAGGGYLYHQNETCNANIIKKIPLSYALRNGRTPCKKCCGK